VGVLLLLTALLLKGCYAPLMLPMLLLLCTCGVVLPGRGVGAGIGLAPFALQHTGSPTLSLPEDCHPVIRLADVRFQYSSSGITRPCTKGCVPSLADLIQAWIRIIHTSLIAFLISMYI